MSHTPRYLTTAIRSALGAGAILGMAMAAAPVMAQDQDEDERTELDRVAVTGSRIMRTDMEGASPVLQFTRADLEATGVNTVQDFVRQLTIASTINFDTFTNSFANSTATIDLRGLGGNSTLVLVNGRRMAPFGRGQNITEAFVDLNSLPLQAIERIEILKDGASAIYGSEAIAGVVNIILRTDYQGAEVQVDVQDTSRRDASERGASAIFGTTAGNTSITANFSFLSREALFSSDRPFSRSADDRPQGGLDRRSNFGFPGTVNFLESGITQPAPGCAPGDVRTFIPGVLETCAFNFNEFINLFPASETFATNNFITHELTPGHSFFSEVSFTRRQATNIAAPAPFTAHSPESLQLLFERGLTPAEVTALGGPIPGTGLLLPAENPFNPFGEDVGLIYRPLAAGPRTEKQTLNAMRVVAGFQGELWDFWDYEAAAYHGRSDVLTQNENAVTRRDLQGLLLGAITDNAGNPLFLDPFGLDNSPEVIERLSSTVRENDRSVEQGATAQLTGPLFSLPAGDLAVAVGGEYREMTLKNVASIARNRGELVGTGQSADSFGERDVWAAFVEFSVPLHRTLEAQLALRHEDYSDFGNTTDPKLGLRWQPIQDLLLRGSWGESFRAPSLFELFQGTTSTFPGGLIDPIRCPDGAGGTNFATTTTIDCGGGQHQADVGGNPDLEPETAEVFNYGLVWNPRALQGLTVAIDYWKFNHKDIIATLPLQLLFNLNDPNIIIRSPRTADDIAAGVPEGGGSVALINNTFVNVARQKTDGADLDVVYRWTTTDVGTFNVGFQATWFNSFEFTNLGLVDGEIVEVITEGVGENILGTRPEWRLRANAGWGFGGHAVHLIGNFRDSVNSFVADSRTGEDFQIGSMTTWDLQYAFQFTDQTRFAIGCINCFDRFPPFDNTQTPGSGFAPDADDPRGARIYGRLIHQF